MKKYYHIPTTDIIELSSIRGLMKADLSGAIDPNAAPARKGSAVGTLYI